MKQWAQVMRKWSLWLLGDEPLPGKGTRAMLAGTLAVLVVLIAGGLALMPGSTPAKHHKAHKAKHSLTLPTLAHPTTTTLAGGTSVTTAPKSAAARARAARRARARARRAGTGTRPKRSTGATTTTTHPATAAAAPSAAGSGSSRLAFSSPVVGPSATDGTAAAAAGGSPVPGGTVAGLASPAPGAKRAAPLAPLATNASTGAGNSLISWKERDRVRVTGYDVFVGAAPDQEWPTPVNGTTLVTGTSYLVTGLTTGQTYYFTVQAVGPGGRSPVSNEVSATPVNAYVPLGMAPGPVVSMAATGDGNGYWMVTSSGAVSAHGSAQDYGSASSLDLAAPIVQIVSTPDGEGYWLVAADGGVFAYGDAAYEGSAAGLEINAPIVGMAASVDGKGYWLVAADGGVFALGDAAFLGSLAGAPASSGSAPLTGLLGLPTGSAAGTPGAAPTPTPATSQVVGIAADPASDGYWLVTAGGTVTGFGAPNLGPETGTFPVDTVVGITASPGGKGYWEVTRSGGVYAYGAAPFHGSTGAVPLNTPVSGMAVDNTSGGYWLVGLDGGIFAFDAPFQGAG